MVSASREWVFRKHSFACWVTKRTAMKMSGVEALEPLDVSGLCREKAEGATLCIHTPRRYITMQKRSTLFAQWTVIHQPAARTTPRTLMTRSTRLGRALTERVDSE